MQDTEAERNQTPLPALDQTVHLGAGGHSL